VEVLQYSPEQQEAIDYRDGHLQIVACAGAGKTEVVSRRIVRLLREGCHPESIIAFTFTEKAAGELKARIVRHVKQEMARTSTSMLASMFVGTTHSYCLSILRDHVSQLAAYDVIDPHRLTGLISREWDRLCLDRLSVEGRWATVQTFLDTVAVVDNELLDPKGFQNTPFHECYLRFLALLQDYRLLTFGQLISRAVRELRVGSLRETIRAQVRYVVVDEYQDINPAQEELILLLAEAPATICVVGDDDQSIYQWRGAQVENIMTFVDRYPGSYQASIPKNRRSKPQIIKTANRISKKIEPRIAKSMLEHRPGKQDEVVAWIAESPEEEAHIVAQTIARIVEQGYHWKDISVLLRSVRTSSRPFIEAFELRGIPYRCAGRTGLFLQPEAQTVGMMYAWLVDATWKSARFDTEVLVTLPTLLEAFRQVFGLTSKELKELKRLLRSMYQEVRDADTVADLIRDYYVILRSVSVHNWDLDDLGALARLGVLAQISKLLADYEGFMRRGWRDPERGHQHRAGPDRGEWFYRHLHTFIQHYALEAYEDFEGGDRFRHDVVQVMTVHQAKGLEWPVVFVPCLSGQRFPSSKTGMPKHWLIPRNLFDARRYEGSLTDERRLFYVSITRARDQLYLSTFRRIDRLAPPSPFFSEASEGNLTDDVDLRLGPEPMEPRQPEDEPLLISFSELAQYGFCPASFTYRVLLGFEPRLVQELGYGRAVHHILRRVGERVLSEERMPTSEEIDRLFEAEFQLPYATRFGFQAMESAGRRLISNYLRDHGSELTRAVAFERRLDLDLQLAMVLGRADLVLKRVGGEESGLEMLDFKLSVDEDLEQEYALQMATYTAAAKQEGLNVKKAYLHDLGTGARFDCAIDDAHLEEATIHLAKACRGILEGHYPHRRGPHCRRCDARLLCVHGAAGW